ncbi:hypothetical protein BU24DRAFT_456371 [Aaosphaeria arxii CBS 175.79]|uniref:Uncharacterized protein n=1 Tax=Aaosphaeria arxii CBS 175.79 TaxID=1450172 RepID=A0A6A5X5U4_9PLEO|nr:uncharacterized protein BU24DRAFT_456371 [Aaosphaeria arxii CBS 175.79]KAF2008338.1 hypothetical protein BU24DRAFT_456371 [Aaosphaeria arxii CBS 175.79]
MRLDAIWPMLVVQIESCAASQPRLTGSGALTSAAWTNQTFPTTVRWPNTTAITKPPIPSSIVTTTVERTTTLMATGSTIGSIPDDVRSAQYSSTTLGLIAVASAAGVLSTVAGICFIAQYCWRQAHQKATQACSRQSSTRLPKERAGSMRSQGLHAIPEEPGGRVTAPSGTIQDDGFVANTLRDGRGLRILIT